MILIFAGTATAIVNQKTPGSETLIGLAGSSGLAVMIVILSTGHISGAHLNPSITIAFAALRHFPWKHVPLYIGAQVLASICAAFTLKVVFDPMMGGGVTVPSVNYAQAYALEFIISFNLMFVVTAVATDTRAVLSTPVSFLKHTYWDFRTRFSLPFRFLYNFMLLTFTIN
ncbi:putative major intrinsic protein [Helianthus anomalus]